MDFCWNSSHVMVAVDRQPILAEFPNCAKKIFFLLRTGICIILMMKRRYNSAKTKICANHLRSAQERTRVSGTVYLGIYHG